MDAAKKAEGNPFLETSIHGARDVLLYIVGTDKKLSQYNLNEAVTFFKYTAGGGTKIIAVSSADNAMKDDTIRMMFVATGLEKCCKPGIWFSSLF